MKSFKRFAHRELGFGDEGRTAGATEDPLEKAGGIARFFELGGAQGLAAVKEGWLLLQNLLKDGDRIIEILSLDGGSSFLIELPDIARNFVKGLFWHGSILLSHRQKSTANPAR